MTRAAFMLLHAILALAFGIGFVLAPASVLALYGVATDPAGTFMARLWGAAAIRSEEHTSELQSQSNLVCRLLLEKKKRYNTRISRLHDHSAACYPTI